jgi:hypothetical protein
MFALLLVVHLSTFSILACLRCMLNEALLPKLEVANSGGLIYKAISK